jgi:outer membrane lipoprotein SlyB
MSAFSKIASGGRYLVFLGAAVGLTACATPLPLAPSFTALPKTGESFADFQRTDANCRAFATAQSGEPTAEARENRSVGSALLGAGLGAATGAAIGSASGRAGNGAAIGAGSGLLLGAALGGQQNRRTQMVVQRRYDGAYAQCMTAAGERLPQRPPPVVYAPAPVVMAPPPVIVAPAYAYPPPPWMR